MGIAIKKNTLTDAQNKLLEQSMSLIALDPKLKTIISKSINAFTDDECNKILELINKGLTIEKEYITKLAELHPELMEKATQIKDEKTKEIIEIQKNEEAEIEEEKMKMLDSEIDKIE